MLFTEEQAKGSGQPCETVQVKHGDDYMVINAHEFIEGTHELYVPETEAEAEAKAKAKAEAEAEAARLAAEADDQGDGAKKRSRK